MASNVIIDRSRGNLLKIVMLANGTRRAVDRNNDRSVKLVMVDGINSQPVNNSLILNVYNLWSKTVIDFSRFRLIWFDQGLPTTIDYSVSVFRATCFLLESELVVLWYRVEVQFTSLNSHQQCYKSQHYIVITSSL